MSKPLSRRSHTFSGAFSLVALFGLAFAVSLGCGKSEAAPSPSARGESASILAGAAVDADNYKAEMKASGAYKAGTEGLIEVTLVPKNGYHINKQYPYKFKVSAPPEGVTFPKAILTRDDGKFEETSGSFKVPFTAAKAGSVTVAGTFSLSVCSDANCVMDKVELALTVDVK